MFGRYHIVSALICSFTFNNLAISETPEDCVISPPFLSIQVPNSGFEWRVEEPFEGECPTVAKELWRKQEGRSMDLLVAADGPSGSGRFWTVTIGLGKPEEFPPRKGFCIQTSTNISGSTSLCSCCKPVKTGRVG